LTNELQESETWQTSYGVSVYVLLNLSNDVSSHEEMSQRSDTCRCEGVENVNIESFCHAGWNTAIED
jgi:hypothetical protein